jgi:hypothetical protein
VAAEAKSSYSAEQEALRRETDGEAPLREQIRAPEVNPEVYTDVIPLLFRGFLTVPVAINNVRFVLKTLNQHEFELMRWMGFEGLAFWDYFLAYAVLYVDGKNVLRDRDTWLGRIAQTFHDMDRGARQKIIRHLSELNRRASNAITLTEAYAMEPYSRFRWGQLQGLDLSHPSVTGIVGTETLGLNWAQLVWRSLNYYEDMSMRVEREWENAKFVGACFAGKGVQKIYNQDNDRRQKDQTARITRRDQLLRHVFEGVPLEQEKTKDGRIVATAKTVEELADQLEKSLRGEKDFHDRVIEEWEARTRKRVDDRRQHLQDLMQRNEAIFAGHGVIGGSSMEGLSAAEVAERMSRRKQYEAQAAARMQVHPEETDPKVAEVVDRYYPAKGPEGETPRVVPLVPQREVGKPFRR